MRQYLVTLQSRWPWVRAVIWTPAPAPVAAAVAQTSAPATPAAPAAAQPHKSWVRTHHGVGWLVRHEGETGWIVSYPDRGQALVPNDNIENISPEEAAKA